MAHLLRRGAEGREVLAVETRERIAAREAFERGGRQVDAEVERPLLALQDEDAVVGDLERRGRLAVEQVILDLDRKREVVRPLETRLDLAEDAVAHCRYFVGTGVGTIPSFESFSAARRLPVRSHRS